MTNNNFNQINNSNKLNTDLFTNVELNKLNVRGFNINNPKLSNINTISSLNVNNILTPRDNLMSPGNYIFSNFSRE